MNYSRQEAIEKLIKSYEAYYNVTMDDLAHPDLRAFCEFYEHSGQYVISKKAEIWSASCEEFIYLFETEHLNLENYKSCIEFANEDGMKHAHIGPGHMYTYITPVFICDSCDDDVKKAVRKCHISKSFRFSFHGWMEFRTAMLEVKTNNITNNGSGRSVKKVLKSVLFNTNKRRRGLFK